MNKGSIILIASIAAAACFFVCEPVPQEAFINARTSLEKAEKSGAQIWAPTQLKTGHTFYDSAMKELSLEKRKLPFKRNYKKIIELLDVATYAGQYALESMQAANERMKSEYQELLDRAKDLADSMYRVINAPGVNKKNIGHLQALLDSARTAQEEALEALNNGDFFLAEGKAVSAGNKTAEAARSITAFFPAPEKSTVKKK